MAKTQEELKQLKDEYETLVSKVKELSDDELKSINGGQYYDNVYYKTKDEVQFIHNVGDEVEVYSGWFFGTVRCKIVDRRKVYFETHNTGAPGIPAFNVCGYRDEYLVKELNSHWYFYYDDEWISRNEIQM